jgi:hypothetical protein
VPRQNFKEIAHARAVFNDSILRRSRRLAAAWTIWGGGRGQVFFEHYQAEPRAPVGCSTEVQAELPCILSKLLARNPQEAAGRTLSPTCKRARYQ